MLVYARPDYLQYAINHSGSLPLDVRAPKTPENRNIYCRETHQLLLSSLPRLRTAPLFLTDTYCGWIESSGFLATEAPLLVQLNVRICGQGLSAFRLSNMAFPRLTSLTLHYYPGDRRSLWLETFARPRLTRLRLFDASLDVSVLVQALSHLPCLGYLHLQNVSGSSPLPATSTLSALPPPADVACLPRLQSLHIEHGGQGAAGAHILNHLVFPPQTAIKFICHGPQVAPVLRFVAAKITRSDPTKACFCPRSMQLDERKLGELLIELWDLMQPLDVLDRSVEGVTNGPPSPRLSLSIDGLINRAGDALASVLTDIDTSEVITMRIGAYLSPDTCRRIFRPARKLRSIQCCV